MRTRVLVTSFAAAAVMVAASAFAQTPTLAELAKKEEARRKAVQAPTKVVTGDDVKKGTPAAPAAPATGVSAPQPPAGAKPTAAAGTDDKTAKRADEPAKDQAYWHERITQVREELRRNEMFAEALQTRINSLTADFTARDDPYQRARIGEDRVKALAELDRLKTETDLLKKKIAEIEEEARRAGVPPGWLR